jgi:hypothetical protein
MPHSFNLLNRRIHQIWMTMAERMDCYSLDKVQIAIPIHRKKEWTFCSVDDEIGGLLQTRREKVRIGVSVIGGIHTFLLKEVSSA